MWLLRIGRRMVVARSNCSRMGVERRSNRSRIVVVATALAGDANVGRYSGRWHWQNITRLGYVSVTNI